MVDRMWMWMAWRLPRRLVYWAFVRMAARPWDWPGDRKVYEVMDAWASGSR